MHVMTYTILLRVSNFMEMFTFKILRLAQVGIPAVRVTG